MELIRIIEGACEGGGGGGLEVKVGGGVVKISFMLNRAFRNHALCHEQHLYVLHRVNCRR